MSEPRDRDLMTNAIDEEQIKRARRIELDRHRRRRGLLRQQLSTPDGREYVWGQLEAAGIYRDCIGDAVEMAAFLGRRRLGLELLIELTTFHASEYLQMQNEAMAREDRARRENAAARTPPAGA